MKQYLILAGILILLLIITLFFILSGGQKKIGQTTPSPTPQLTTTPAISIPAGVDESYNQKQTEENKTEQPILDKMANIITFRESLPYNGKYIQITFDLKNDQYILTINKDNIAAGQDEFNNLLKHYNVDSDFIQQRLKLVYK